MYRRGPSTANEKLLDAVAAALKRDLSSIEDFAAGLRCFITKMASPVHHVRVGEVWLIAMGVQSCTTRGVIAVHEDDVRTFDTRQGEGFVNEGDAHLALEED